MTQKGFANIILIVLVVILAGSGFYFIGGKPPIKYWTKNPTNFEECKEATRGAIIETLPAQCEFRGKNFIDQSHAQEDVGFPSPTVQEAPRISPKLQKIITENPEEIVNIFINLSYDPGLQIIGDVNASALGLQKKELERQIQEAAASGIRGDSPEYLALFKKLDDAELVLRQEIAKRLEVAYKPSQDEVSSLVVSLGGEVTNRYAISNLLAARIKARQIAELAKSPLVESVSDVQVVEALGTNAQKSDEAKPSKKISLTNNIFLISFIAILIIGFISFLVLRRQKT